MGNQYSERTSARQLEKEVKGLQKFLVLHNDDVHTFDYVIDSLIDVFEMETVVAEQITYIVHFKGKCDVKKGDEDILKPLRIKLIKKGLIATID